MSATTPASNPGMPEAALLKETPQLSAALSAQGLFASRNPALTAPGWNSISLATAATLQEWGLPDSLIAAALLSPLVEHGKAALGKLGVICDPASSRLAERLVSWRHDTATLFGSEDLVSLLSMQLRSLFREVYLDHADNFRFTLLLLAEHNARIAVDSPSPFVARQTVDVFVPVTEMLGLWTLRRVWLDRSMAVLEPARYRHVETLLIQQTSARQGAFADFCQSFLKHAQKHEISPTPELEIVPTPPGTGLHPFREERSEEEFAGRMVVRIVCDSPIQCYAVLGLTHKLGKPVGPRFSTRFDDFIAAPEPNGYQALYTSVSYSWRDEQGRHRDIVAEIRVVTREMRALNEWGVVEALYRREYDHKGTLAWWNQMGRLDDDLARHYRTAEHPQLYPYNVAPAGNSSSHRENLPAFLQSFPPGSTSDIDVDPIYVFTPHGQLVLLKRGSTPLDFAYRVHTEIGNRTDWVKVNERPAPLHQALQNGDCVRVHHSPMAPGPDFPWLTWAATPHSRRKIRRALGDQARQVHEGRGKFEEAVLKRIEYYKRQKDYDLVVTRDHLDSFLVQVTKLQRLPNVDALYDRIARDAKYREGLVWRLIRQDLARALTDDEGRQLPYPLHRIAFCENCRPVPDENLIAYERQSGTYHEELVVHREGCASQTGQGPRVKVKWGRLYSQRTLASIRIASEDHVGLLGEVLDRVYVHPGASLRKVEAEARVDEKADITLIVEVDGMEVLSSLQDSIQRIRGVQLVYAFPTSQAAIRALAVSRSAHIPNPYTAGEALDRDRFYDRYVEIGELQDWVAQRPETPMIVHGQRRAGKSSLLKIWMQENLRKQRALAPVLVDFQGLTDSTDMASLASYLLTEIQASLPYLPAPTMHQSPGESPTLWLKRSLRGVSNYLYGTSGARLLLIIDEFDVLDVTQAEHDPGQNVFRNLRSVVNDLRDMYWLFVVADGNFYDTGRRRGFGSLLQQARLLAISRLEPQWAARLITEGVARCRLRYEGVTPECRSCTLSERPERRCGNCPPAQILFLTSGRPFYMQLICRELVERARKAQRMTITEDDLDYVTDLLLTDGRRLFDHYLRHLREDDKGQRRRAVLEAIAEQTAPGDWMSLSTLADTLSVRTSRRGPEFNEIVRGLCNLGMIERQKDADLIRLHPPLFHHWVSRTWLGKSPPER